MSQLSEYKLQVTGVTVPNIKIMVTVGVKNRETIPHGMFCEKL